jgi:UDP-N-acetylmuramate dehydrogenase
MNIIQNQSLKNYNTFGIDAKAKEFIAVNTVDALVEVVASSQDLFILGGGSNMLLTQDIQKLVVHLDLKGLEIIEENEDFVIVRAQAGENWHEFVLWCIDQDFGGIENLSLIPGNVGTTPIQNIGAYGVEIKDTLFSCEALNRKTLQIETFTNEQCKFDYRESVFKNELKELCSLPLRLILQESKGLRSGFFFCKINILNNRYKRICHKMNFCICIFPNINFFF